ARVLIPPATAGTGGRTGEGRNDNIKETGAGFQAAPQYQIVKEGTPMMQPNAGNARSRGFAQDAGHTHTAPPRAATCSVGRRVSVAVLVAALALSALLSGGALGTPLALAQGDITPAAALERLLTAEALEAEWFTPEFLAELPLGQTQAIVRQITAGLGQLQAIEGSGMQYQAIFDNGVLP